MTTPVMSPEPKPIGMDPKLFLRLAAPFEASEVKYRPAQVSGNRAMALFYIDARCVMERLDDEVGPANWRDEYQPFPSGSVECRLSLKLNGDWITKADVGSISEQRDEGDRTKAAYSDALKRAAVKWGIGRYLYKLGQTWADYDPQKKQFARPPQLPAWAVPDRTPINGAQAKELLGMMTECGLAEETLCKAYGVKAVAELPAGRFLEAFRRIALYGRQAKASPTPTPAQPAKEKAS